MSDLISRDALKSAMCEGCDGEACNRTTFDCYSMKAIIEAPTIDAEPIVHGHWDVVTVGTNFHTDRLCRNCKKTIKSNYWCYCPNCGAKMDEKENNNDE